MISSRHDTLTCQECGGTVFLQKQTWKTGVRVVNGRAVFNRSLATSKFTMLICENCNVILPTGIVKLIIPLPEDHQLKFTFQEEAGV